MFAGSKREAEFLNLAGSLSVTAALVHFAVTAEHFAEWWGYGVFFLIVAAAQLLYGAALLSRAWGITPASISARGGSIHAPLFYATGILGNLFLIALYIVTRTSGIPLGPSAGQVEAMNWVDIGSKAVEMLLVFCLALLFVQKNARVWQPAR